MKINEINGGECTSSEGKDGDDFLDLLKKDECYSFKANNVSFLKQNHLSNILQDIYNPNPFKTTINVDGHVHNALLDFGADVSLINIKNIRNKEIIKSSGNISITSATNNKIKIIGEVKGLKIYKKEKCYLLNALVTNEYSYYTILGINFIKKYTDLLINCITEFKTKKLDASTSISSVQVNQNALEEIVSKFEDLFKEEITNSELCTLGQIRST